MTAAASTLAQRRATLKKLMADPKATFDQYRGIINGATEKERASLARTLNAEKAAASDLPKSIKAYLAAALTANQHVPHNNCINLHASPRRDASVSGVKYVTTSCGELKKEETTGYSNLLINMHLPGRHSTGSGNLATQS